MVCETQMSSNQTVMVLELYINAFVKTMLVFFNMCAHSNLLVFHRVLLNRLGRFDWLIYIYIYIYICLHISRRVKYIIIHTNPPPPFKKKRWNIDKWSKSICGATKHIFVCWNQFQAITFDLYLHLFGGILVCASRDVVPWSIHRGF